LVRNVRFVVNQLHNGKLDSTLIGESALQSEILKIQTLAANKDQKLPAIAAQSLYTLPISYKIPSNGYLYIYIDIPLLSNKLNMDLYRQIPIPFRVDNRDYLFNTQDSYLLVGKSPTDVFTTLNDAQFNRCNNLDGLLVCSEVPNLLRHDEYLQGKDKQRCTYALFDADAVAVANFCTVQPPQHLEVVHFLGNNLFVMYTSRPVDLEVNCPEQTTYKFQVNHTATIFMPAGCTAETRANYFYALSRVESDNNHLNQFVDSSSFLQKVNQQKGLLSKDMLDPAQYRIEANQVLLHDLQDSLHAVYNEVDSVHQEMDSVNNELDSVYATMGYDERPNHVAQDMTSPSGITAIVALSIIAGTMAITGVAVYKHRRNIKALIRFINTNEEMIKLKGQFKTWRQVLGAKIAGNHHQVQLQEENLAQDNV